MHLSARVASLLLALVAPACAAAPGTRPHDMSMAAHNATAARADQSARALADQPDPSTESRPICVANKGCWTWAERREDAQQQRELAAKHRAASAALGQAEQQACVGISEDDRDMSPFYHRQDIASVRRLTRQVRQGKSVTLDDVGATVVFRAVPGLTAEWLQREVDCHIARASSVGHDMPEMSYCPLVLKGVKATVSAARGGFAVNIESDDWDVTKEIVRRSNALLPTGAVAVSGTSSQ